MLIVNALVLHFDRLEDGCDVRLVDGKIAAIGPRLSLASDGPVLDASGCYVLPGLLDLHNHGVRHVMAQYDSLLEYAQLMAAEGATTCLPTLLSSPRENMDVMRRCLRETGGLRRTPNVLGFRPEITYLAKTGAGLIRIADAHLRRDN